MYTIEQPALHICNYIKIVALTTQTQEIVLNLLTRGAWAIFHLLSIS